MHPAIKSIAEVGRTALLVVAVSAVLIVCEDPPSGPGSSVEFEEARPQPSDQAVEVSLSPYLAWPAAGASERIPRYDLYLDTINPPSLFRSNLTQPYFSPGLLFPNHTYYWRTVTRGTRRLPRWPLWSFTTRSLTYPVMVGNRWLYDQAAWYENIQPSSLVPRFGDTTRATVSEEVAEFLGGIDGPDLYRFHHTYVPPRDRSEGDAYYEVREDGLYQSWESGVNLGVIPKQSGTVRYIFGGRSFGSTEELFSFLETGLVGPGPTLSTDQLTRQALQYPLKVGAQWTYLHPTEYSYQIDRKVIDWQRIEIGEAAYDCFVIQSLYDLDGDGLWEDNIEFYDYIAAQGLVKRRFVIYGIRFADWSRANGIGTADFVSESILTELHLVQP